MKWILSLLITGCLCTPLAWADAYLLVMSKNDEVCQHMYRLYNLDLKQKGKVVLEGHEEYAAVAWDEEVTFSKVRAVEHGKLRTFKKKLFDINNDGKDETVLFRRTYYNWKMEYQTDHLRYIESSYQINYDEDTLLKLNNEKRMVSLGGMHYNLKELPVRSITSRGRHVYPHMNSVYLIRPFKLKGEYYLSLFGNVGLSSPVDFSWQEDVKNDIAIKNGIVITQYDANNTLNDVCYFIRPQPFRDKAGAGE